MSAQILLSPGVATCGDSARPGVQMDSFSMSLQLWHAAASFFGIFWACHEANQPVDFFIASKFSDEKHPYEAYLKLTFTLAR
jgi:hypothetical protein